MTFKQKKWNSQSTLEVLLFSIRLPFKKENDVSSWCTPRFLDGLTTSPKVKTSEGKGVRDAPWLVAFWG
jgi:hypothetical protein